MEDVKDCLATKADRRSGCWSRDDCRDGYYIIYAQLLEADLQGGERRYKPPISPLSVSLSPLQTHATEREHQK
jgi:hypothetical protein